ncbi:hypothetical protein BKA65DRAFT_516899 [Rhexocercosporidium sp. MPI-PUGE-AT-0058]|nr:hypothetical protein BKA65DRAFT_516899 [Rhexocercosporidium sp. MPI-PUGE-AT-0058]
MLSFLSLQCLQRLVIGLIWTFLYGSFANKTASAHHSEHEIEPTDPAADAGEVENRNTEIRDTSCNEDGNLLTDRQLFWFALRLTAESAEELFSAFPQVIVENPDLHNKGIRKLSVDETLRVNNPPVVFNIAARPEWNAETRNLAPILSLVHIVKSRITYSAPEWDRWTCMREHLLTSLKELYTPQTDCAPDFRPPGDDALLLHQREHFQYWNLFSGASVHLLELWYGNASFLSPVVVRRRNYGESGSKVQASEKSSDDLFFGRIWTINPKDQTLPIHIALFAASQVCLNHDSGLQEWPRECAWMLPVAFSSPWPSSPWIRFCCTGQRLFHAQFHVRYWTVCKASTDSVEDLPRYSGLCTQRAAFEITSYHKKTHLLIREARVSVGIITPHSSTKSHFSIVGLADDPSLSLKIHEDDYCRLFVREQSPAKAGFVATQAVVARMIKQWAYEWTKTLECFDVLGTPCVDQTHLQNKRPALTDTHQVSLTQEQEQEQEKEKERQRQRQRQQQLSTRRLLQSIAEAKEAILDTSSWFKNLIEDFNSSLKDAVTDGVRENWAILSNYHGQEETRLLQYLNDMDQKLSVVDSTPIFRPSITIPGTTSLPTPPTTP